MTEIGDDRFGVNHRSFATFMCVSDPVESVLQVNNIHWNIDCTMIVPVSIFTRQSQYTFNTAFFCKILLQFFLIRPCWQSLQYSTHPLNNRKKMRVYWKQEPENNKFLWSRKNTFVSIRVYLGRGFPRIGIHFFWHIRIGEDTTIGMYMRA